MEKVITIFIYIHVFFGGIGLITGILSVMVKKGSTLHKRMGIFFAFSMIMSTLITLPISWMPNHENLFLFLIGLFTIYLALSGHRALSFKTKIKADWLDKTISGFMFLFSVIMLIKGTYGVLYNITFSVLYLFFGGFGLFFASKDFMFYTNINRSKNTWLTLHIGKMMGALIASITAFIVAGLGIVSLMSWTLPTIIGFFYIIYWNRKVGS
jgi:hypothetical protein